MKWTKTKTGIVVGVLLTIGIATIAVKKTEEHKAAAVWRVASINWDDEDKILASVPPQVLILPSKFSEKEVGYGPAGEFGTTLDGKMIGIGVPIASIVKMAYSSAEHDWTHGQTIVSTNIPSGRYDFIATLTNGNAEALQEEVKRQFGVVGKIETQETDVLVLKLSNPDAQGFQPPNSTRSRMNVGLDVHEINVVTNKGSFFAFFDQTFDQSRLKEGLERQFGLPIIDETGLTDRYDFSYTLPFRRTPGEKAFNQATKKNLFDDLGLELVPNKKTVEMLIVEKAQ
jgi:uncharacterized protein (TIGR03435 family)